MADDATRTSTTSLEDDDDQRYLDDAAWARREEGYRQQIKALEEQHKTLKNAWSDIVRTNLLKVDELKKELETKRAKRDSIRDALAAARSTGAATHDRLVAELCSAKVEVADDLLEASVGHDRPRGRATSFEGGAVGKERALHAHAVEGGLGACRRLLLARLGEWVNGG